MNANGISRDRVIPNPLYKPANGLDCSDTTIWIVEYTVEDPAAFVCILVFITSVGTRTRQAAISPILAEIICEKEGRFSKIPYLCCRFDITGLAVS